MISTVLDADEKLLWEINYTETNNDVYLHLHYYVMVLPEVDFVTDFEVHIKLYIGQAGAMTAISFLQRAFSLLGTMLLSNVLQLLQVCCFHYFVLHLEI